MLIKCLIIVGEASGKASKGLAKIIPGAGGMQQLHQQAGAVGGDFARTRMVSTFLYFYP